MLEQRTFTFPFEDEDWGNKFLVGSLFYLLAPFLLFIPLIIPQGYALRVWRDAVAGLPPRLPEWDQWDDMGVRGLAYYAITFVYSLPLWIMWAFVAAVAGGGVLALVWASEGMESGDASTILSVVLALFFVIGVGMAIIIALALSFFIVLLLTVALGRYLENSRFGAAFEFGAVWRTMRANAGGLVMAWGVLLITSLLLTVFVGQLNAIPCLGPLLVYLLMSPIMFYVSLVQARVMGLAYHEAQCRLGAAPSSEPEPEEQIAQPPVALEALELSTRVQRLLRDAGLSTVEQVLERLAHGDEQLLDIQGLGPRSLEEIKAQLAAHGFLD